MISLHPKISLKKGDERAEDTILSFQQYWAQNIPASSHNKSAIVFSANTSLPSPQRCIQLLQKWHQQSWKKADVSPLRAEA